MPEERKRVNDSDIARWRNGGGPESGERGDSEESLTAAFDLSRISPPGPQEPPGLPGAGDAAAPAESRTRLPEPLPGDRRHPEPPGPDLPPQPTPGAPARSAAGEVGVRRPRPTLGIESVDMIRDAIMRHLSEETLTEVTRREREVDMFEVLSDAVNNAAETIENDLAGLDTESRHMRGEPRIYGVSGDGTTIFSPTGSASERYRPVVRRINTDVGLLESAIPLWEMMGFGNTEQANALRNRLKPARRTADIYHGLVECNEALERFDFEGYRGQKAAVSDLIRKARAEGVPSQSIKKYEREISDRRAGFSGLEAKYIVSDLIWNLYSAGIITAEGRTDDEKRERLRTLRNRVLRDKMECLESGDEGGLVIAICTSTESVGGVKLHYRLMDRGAIKRSVSGERNTRLAHDLAESVRSQSDVEGKLAQLLERMGSERSAPGGDERVLQEIRGIREQMAAMNSRSDSMRRDIAPEEPNWIKKYGPYVGTAAGTVLLTLIGGWLFGGSPETPAPIQEPPSADAPAEPPDRGAGGKAAPDTHPSPFDKKFKVYDADVVPLSPGDSRQRLLIRFGPDSATENKDRFVGYMELMPGEEGNARTLVQELERHGIYVNNTPGAGGLKPEMGKLTDRGWEIYLTRSHFRHGNE